MNKLTEANTDANYLVKILQTCITLVQEHLFYLYPDNPNKLQTLIELHNYEESNNKLMICIFSI